MQEVRGPGTPMGRFAVSDTTVGLDVGASLVRVGVTGRGRSLLSPQPACASENEVLCLVRGLSRSPRAPGSVIEIGGQTARWVQGGRSPQGAPCLADFALNDQCAAGVGAFLVQQASRLRMSVEVRSHHLARSHRASPSQVELARWHA